jgi:hypothetical protein
MANAADHVFVRCYNKRECGARGSGSFCNNECKSRFFHRRAPRSTDLAGTVGFVLQSSLPRAGTWEIVAPRAQALANVGDAKKITLEDFNLGFIGVVISPCYSPIAAVSQTFALRGGGKSDGHEQQMANRWQSDPLCILRPAVSETRRALRVLAGVRWPTLLLGILRCG